MLIEKTFKMQANAQTVYSVLRNNNLKKYWMSGLVKIDFPDGDEEGRFILHLKEGNKITKYYGYTIGHKENELIKIHFDNESKTFGADVSYEIIAVNNNSSKLQYKMEGYSNFNSKFSVVFNFIGKIFSYFILKNQMKKLNKLAIKESSK